MVMKGSCTACIVSRSFPHKAARFYIDLSMCEVSKVHISKRGTTDLYDSEYTDIYRQFSCQNVDPILCLC